MKKSKLTEGRLRKNTKIQLKNNAPIQFPSGHRKNNWEEEFEDFIRFGQNDSSIWIDGNNIKNCEYLTLVYLIRNYIGCHKKVKIKARKSKIVIERID